ncbi:MAG: Nif3-like dinuclear metal center hexameric protein [Clostridiales bacterium]|nr:Nif3-like dinuclear metal center hexameric protein [Clostridiales bacterium]
MAITVGEAVAILRDFAPEEYGYKKEYDNIGLILGDESRTVTRVLCCLDVTMTVIDEAIRLDAELIISHHPMLFYPIQNVNASTVVGKKLLKAAENGIAIYAAHTNLDFVRDGINDYVAQMLGLHNVTSLEPYIDGETGYGRVGDLANKVYSSVLKGEVESVLKDAYVRTVGEPYAQVKRVAVINGGSGGDTKYVDMAIKAGADCLITADVKHHVAVYASESGITLIEPQHFTMEHCYISRLVQILKIEAKARKADIEIVQSQAEHNPRY